MEVSTKTPATTRGNRRDPRGNATPAVDRRLTALGAISVLA
jgi:hypothetical protein